jgi:hypothetical protein
MASVQRRNGSRDLEGGGVAATRLGRQTWVSFMSSTPGLGPCLGGQGTQPTFASLGSFEARIAALTGLDKGVSRCADDWRWKSVFDTNRTGSVLLCLHRRVDAESCPATRRCAGWLPAPVDGRVGGVHRQFSESSAIAESGKSRRLDPLVARIACAAQVSGKLAG